MNTRYNEDSETMIRFLKTYNGFYNYILYDDTSGMEIPFYVGKGKGMRCLQHVRNHPGTNKNVKDLIQSIHTKNHKVIYELCNLTYDENDSFQHEIILIKDIGRKDLGLGPLLNRNDGGRGGGNISKQSVQKMIDTQKSKYVNNPQLRIDMSEIKKQQYINDSQLKDRVSKGTKLIMSLPHIKHNVSVAQKERATQNPNHLKRSGIKASYIAVTKTLSKAIQSDTVTPQMITKWIILERKYRVLFPNGNYQRI